MGPQLSCVAMQMDHDFPFPVPSWCATRCQFTYALVLLIACKTALTPTYSQEYLCYASCSSQPVWLSNSSDLLILSTLCALLDKTLMRYLGVKRGAYGTTLCGLRLQLSRQILTR